MRGIDPHTLGAMLRFVFQHQSGIYRCGIFHNRTIGTGIWVRAVIPVFCGFAQESDCHSLAPVLFRDDNGKAVPGRTLVVIVGDLTLFRDVRVLGCAGPFCHDLGQRAPWVRDRGTVIRCGIIFRCPGSIDDDRIFPVLVKLQGIRKVVVCDSDLIHDRVWVFVCYSDRILHIFPDFPLKAVCFFLDSRLGDFHLCGHSVCPAHVREGRVAIDVIFHL